MPGSTTGRPRSRRNGKAEADRPGASWMRAVRRALLRFYDTARRDLPWRRTTDPYRIWVSEVMLQQTRVDTVIPFYERWLALFPTLDALAAAPAEQVLKAWEGLGYYRRARNLHSGAQLVRERHSGRVPDDPRTLRTLPGVGEYTAGAIASIAFGRSEPAVDGNVRRVLARLLDDPDPDPAKLRTVAAHLVPRNRAGEFNQALMELGATVCTSRSPACDRCPVVPQCAAHRAGTQHDRPAPRPRRPVPVFDLGTAVVIDAADRLLLVRRPDRGLLAGLFAFPAAVIAPGEPAASAARRSIPFQLPEAMTPLDPVEHTFTHRKERYHPFVFHMPGSAETVVSASEGMRWTPIPDLDRLPMPVAQREIARIGIGGSGL